MKQKFVALFLTIVMVASALTATPKIRYNDTINTTVGGQTTLTQSFGCLGQRIYYATFGWRPPTTPLLGSRHCMTLKNE